MKKIILLPLLVLTLSGCFDNKTTKIENCADSYWARDNHFYKVHPNKVKVWKRYSMRSDGDRTYEDDYRAEYKFQQEFLKKKISKKLLIADYEKYYFKECEREREEAPITFDEKWKSFVKEMSDY